MAIDRDATLKRAEKLLRQGKLEPAIAEYVRLVSAHPWDAASINALGDLYLRAGRTDLAIVQFVRVADQLAHEKEHAKSAAVYRKVLRISPGDQRAVRGLGQLDARRAASRGGGGRGGASEDPDAVILAAREAQDSGDAPRACALLIEAADLYAARNRRADEVAALAEASGIDPANAAYRLRMLNALIAQGELLQARCVARAAPELLRVAEALDAAGRGPEALDTITEAALADPDDRVLRERALRRFVLGGDLARARSLARSAGDLRMLAGVLQAQNRSAEALELFTEAVAREPQNLDLRGPLVAAALAIGDLERARAAARTSGDWMLLAEALQKQGRGGDALAAMREAAQRDPHDAALHARFVRACIEAGDLRLAREEARTKGEILAVADALGRQGDRAGAVALHADALRRDPDDPELRVQLVRELVAAGDRDRAHALLTIDVAGDDLELIMLLARLEFGLGRLEEARRALRHLLAVRSDRLDDVRTLGRELAGAGQGDAAFVCVDLAADAAADAGEWPRAVADLEGFVDRVPHHVPALLKLIEICVDGNLTGRMRGVQERLADAYLHAGRGAEARLIAEDLVLRAPWEPASVDRLVRALVLEGDCEPEQTVANLLCIDSSFMLEGS